MDMNAIVTRRTLRPGSTGHMKSQSRILVENGSHTGPEKLLLFLLIIAAVMGIVYGFSSLVDMVQNWAIIERGTANLI